MFTLALDAPQPPSLSAVLLGALLVPAEMRPAGSLGGSAFENQLSATYSYCSTVPDAWMDETLGYIQRCRSYRYGWDGGEALAPSAASLRASEYLTAFFAEWPAPRRPGLAIDIEGRPNFASKAGDFYLHLTVDSAGGLAWYAVTGAGEHYEENVPFDGTSLPSALAKLAL